MTGRLLSATASVITMAGWFAAVEGAVSPPCFSCATNEEAPVSCVDSRCTTRCSAPSGACCQAGVASCGAGVGEDRSPAATCVCEFDSFCCETSWDLQCVQEAKDRCSLDCAGGAKDFGIVTPWMAAAAASTLDAVWPQRVLDNWKGWFSGPVSIMASTTKKSGGDVTPFFSSRTPEAVASGVQVNHTTVYEIGSVSKVFCALMAEVAAGEARVNFTMALTLADIYPNLQLLPQVANITMTMLASHTSGLPRTPPNMGPPSKAAPVPDNDYTEEMMLNALTNLTDAVLTPQGEFLYSNMAFGLLGMAIVEQNGRNGQPSDMNFQQILETYVTAPLGMGDTVAAYTSKPAIDARMLPPTSNGQIVPRLLLGPALIGAGGLLSTLEDMMKFADFVILKDETDPKLEYLRQASARMRVVIASMGPDMGASTNYVGIAWERYNQRTVPTWWKDGATVGMGSLLAFDSTLTKATVILVNAGPTSAMSWSGFTGQAILAGPPPQYTAAAGITGDNGDTTKYTMANLPEVDLVKESANSVRLSSNEFLSKWYVNLTNGHPLPYPLDIEMHGFANGVNEPAFHASTVNPTTYLEVFFNDQDELTWFDGSDFLLSPVDNAGLTSTTAAAGQTDTVAKVGSTEWLKLRGFGHWQ